MLTTGKLALLTNELLPRTHALLHRTFAVVPVQGPLVLAPDGRIDDAICGEAILGGNGAPQRDCARRCLTARSPARSV